MKMQSQRGFTLIEIMVALLIMAGLSLIMAQSVKSGLESRKKVQLQITEEALIRDAMRLMVSDVGASFHHRDYTVSNFNKVLELRKKKAATGTQPGQVSGGAPPGTNPGVTQPGQVSGGAPTQGQQTAPDPLASATPLPEPNQLTAFVGSNEAMTFTVRNHVRRLMNAKESDQARVAYFIRSCRNEGKSTSLSSCLVRQETTNPTDQFPLNPGDEEDAKGVVLVHHVLSYKLRYLEAGKTDYVESWDSSPAGTNGETKDKFPDAVEISLSIQDKTNPESKLRMLSWLAPVRNSNNLDAGDKEAAAKAAEAAAAGANGAKNPTGALGSGTGPGGTKGQQQ